MLISRTVPEFTTTSQLVPFSHSYDQMASTFKVAKKAVTLPPTVRTLSSGVPHPTLVNLAAVGGGGHHGHGHSSPRSDVQPKWSGGVSRTSSGLVSKTFVTCTKIHAFFVVTLFLTTAPFSTRQHLLTTTVYPYLNPR